ALARDLHGENVAWRSSPVIETGLPPRILPGRSPPNKIVRYVYQEFPMIQAHVKKQFDAAIENVESALRDLSDRLESLSQSRRPPTAMRRAGRNLKRRATSF